MDSYPSDPNVEDYSIQLLNTYAANIECIQIDFRKNLLMVLLQSGHLDIWYKSHQMLGAIQHLSHEISYFTHYDYDPCDNTFYITTPDEVSQIQVIYDPDLGSICECRIHEVHKPVCGIVACTWVESLQQLVCLSYNNIFYRLCFRLKTNGEENFKEIDIKYENYHNLYALTTHKMKELIGKAQCVNELMELPAQLHNSIELEFQKQQLLAVGYKKKLWQKLLSSHIEYHKNIPNHLYFDKDIVVIKASFDCATAEQEENTMYALVYLSLNKKDSALLAILQTTTWYLDMFCCNTGESLLLHLPAEMLHKSICFIIRYNTSKHKGLLPNFTLNLRTFIQHCSQYICLNIDIDVGQNEQTYCHTFCHGVQQWSLTQNQQLDPDCLIRKFKEKTANALKPAGNVELQIKQVFKITKSFIVKILERFNVKYDTFLNTNNFELNFLQLHPLYLNYDENLQILRVAAENLESLMYFKLYLMFELRSSITNANIDLTNSSSEQLQIMVSCWVK